jgi:hypothetical protein
MQDIIRQLVKKRDELISQAEHLGKAILALGDKATTPRKKRRISAAARKKMSLAAKARWATKKKTTKATS